MSNNWQRNIEISNSYIFFQILGKYENWNTKINGTNDGMTLTTTKKNQTFFIGMDSRARSAAWPRQHRERTTVTAVASTISGNTVVS